MAVGCRKLGVQPLKVKQQTPQQGRGAAQARGGSEKASLLPLWNSAKALAPAPPTWPKAGWHSRGTLACGSGRSEIKPRKQEIGSTGAPQGNVHYCSVYAVAVCRDLP